MVILFLVFWGTSILISIVAALIYIPPTVYKDSLFPLHLLLFIFWMIAILTDVIWNHNVILAYISFMTKDAEHFFMHLSVICTLSLENCLFNSPIYKLDYLIFCCFFLVLYVFWILILWWIADKDFIPIL
jgi:hypothetical protein